MDIPKRRKHLLEEVVKIYQDTLLPVHYSTIAEAVGISKWTAYDVMKVLEKDGYLKRTYKKNQNDTGRSMVLFIPTEEVIKLFPNNLEQMSKPKEKEIKEQISIMKKFFNNHSYNKSVIQFLERMNNLELKSEFCFSFLGILAIYYNQLGKDHINLKELMVTISNKPYVQLSVFVGLVVGMITSTESDHTDLSISKNSYQFFEFLDELNSDDLNKLVDFLNRLFS